MQREVVAELGRLCVFGVEERSEVVFLVLHLAEFALALVGGTQVARELHAERFGAPDVRQELHSLRLPFFDRLLQVVGVGVGDGLELCQLGVECAEAGVQRDAVGHVGRVRVRHVAGVVQIHGRRC